MTTPWCTTGRGAAILTFLAVSLASTPSVRCWPEPRVCVGAVALWGSAQDDPFPSESSVAAQDMLLALLESADISVLHPKVRETSLEELTAIANAHAASLAVGVRFVAAANASCVALHVPPRPNTSAAEARPITDHTLTELQLLVRHAEAVAKADESGRLAALIEAAVPTCPGVRDETAEYFLSASHCPAIVVEIRSDETVAEANGGTTGDGLLRSVADVLRDYLAEVKEQRIRVLRRQSP